MLASTFSRPRCAMPMTASSRSASAASVSTASTSGIRDSAPSRENRRCPTNLVCRNISNASATFSRDRMRICSSWSARGMRDLDPVLQPAALFGVLDVHVLGADGAAVRVAQDAQDVPQLHPRLAAEAAGRELALQVPQGQPVQVDVQVGVLALGDLERVGVGHQVAAHPVGVDQLLHPGGPGHVVLVPVREVLDPADRLVRDAQRGEDARRRSRPRPAAAGGSSAGTHRTGRPG